MGVEVPSDLRGLWRREVITAPGFRDETTQVIWLQGLSGYADLRIPADRPSRSGAEGFAPYGDNELKAMARVKGFAGQLTVDGDVCFWRRDMDFQPPTDSPDEGRYSISGDVLIEDGVHADYQEIWRRAPDSIEPAATFQRENEDGRLGLLVISGRYMIEFVSRAGPPPGDANLMEAVETALDKADRALAEDLLSTRIRFAEREGAGPWTTTLSSMPWLQGRPVWGAGAARLGAEAGVLVSGDATAPDRWRLIEATAPASEIMEWLGVLEDSTGGMT